MTNYGKALQFVSNELSNNEQAVTAAVTQNGCVMEYASDEMRNNKQVVTAAVTNYAWRCTMHPMI